MRADYQLGESWDRNGVAHFEFAPAQQRTVRIIINARDSISDDRTYRYDDCTPNEVNAAYIACTISDEYVHVAGFDARITYVNFDGALRRELFVKVAGQYLERGFGVEVLVDHEGLSYDERETSRTHEDFQRIIDTFVVSHDAPTTPTTEVAVVTTVPAATVVAADHLAQPADPQPAQVSRVIDGDTIDVIIEGMEYRVRYIGIDTPETKHPDLSVECFGPEASAQNETLVAGKTVYLEKDASETDRYNRLLRYAWVGQPGALTLVNDELVRLGYANVSTYPPDVKYQDRFIATEEKARSENAGLWAACS